MTYDELLKRVIELTTESNDVFKELQFRDSAWGGDLEIDQLIANLSHVKVKAELILHSLEAYKYDRFMGAVK